MKINYFSKNGTNEENHSVLEQLEELFDISLKVKDRYFTTNDLNPIITDGFLQFGFALSITNSKDMIEIVVEDETGIVEKQYMLPNEKLGYKKDTIDLMRELEFKKEI